MQEEKVSLHTSYKFCTALGIGDSSESEKRPRTERGDARKACSISQIQARKRWLRIALLCSGNVIHRTVRVEIDSAMPAMGMGSGWGQFDLPGGTWIRQLDKFDRWYLFRIWGFICFFMFKKCFLRMKP